MPVVLVIGCSKGRDDMHGTSVAQLAISKAIFSDSVTSFEVNVLYEPGAEPYYGNLPLSTSKVWDITKESYEALFQTHTSREVVVPFEIDQMSAIAPQDQTSWTYNELLELGEMLAPPLVSGTDITATLFFVKGIYDGNSNVLGVHLTGTRFAFIFKDIILGMSSTQKAQIEQAVAVHELGHLVGLVNSGVGMHQDHEDREHRHHSSDREDVMYWAIESASDIGSVLGDLLGTTDHQLFGQNSLNDAHGFHTP